MITFRALPVDYTSVEKINSKYGYMITNQPSFLAEANPYSVPDLEAFRRFRNICGQRGVDANLIVDCFEYTGECGYEESSSRFFGLTTQTEDFCWLKPSKILGLIQTSKIGKNKTRIDYMQVNPFYLYDNPYSIFMHVGRTIEKSIEKIFPADEISVYSPKKVVGFFEKLNYEKVGDDAMGDVLMKLKR